ncbi:uncharacterized protein LOC103991554 isoform X2 [Musa acuminata AAA Group]|uniref:uncharacterized protein LOC103991554 isoform X2 n=1 Tax=Musa acuminata AAA Group TaxID=214697 RepID=UPI0008A0C017|nr:PREDICTED: uncharacterized protein LOC103991554 isoform X3 [Musa acuminata subsp. malaccensis]
MLDRCSFADPSLLISFTFSPAWGIGCLGCYTKPAPIIAVDEPSKGLKIQGRTVKKPNFSEEFWSTSTYEMENSGVQSQKSISSISTLVNTLDHHGGIGSTSNHPEFVNHGLLLWNQTRQKWVGNKRPETQSQQVREPRLSCKSLPDYKIIWMEAIQYWNDF